MKNNNNCHNIQSGPNLDRFVEHALAGNRVWRVQSWKGATMRPLKNPRFWLKAYYTNELEKNPKLTLRAFAKRIGISHSALSEMMSGKRKITGQTIRRFVDGLSLSQGEAEELFRNAYGVVELHRATHSKRYHSVDTESFRVISDWYHIALLALFDVEGFRSSVPWIASRLGVSRKIVREAYHRLKALGYIQLDRKGRPKALKKTLYAKTDRYDLGIRNNIYEHLKRAEYSLDQTPFGERIFQGMTLAIDPGKIEWAREKIHGFCTELTKQLHRGKRTRVYHLSTQLFPVDELRRAA